MRPFGTTLEDWADDEPLPWAHPESELAYCKNGHELWVELDERGEVTAAKESFARSTYVDCDICPRCGAEIIDAPSSP